MEKKWSPPRLKIAPPKDALIGNYIDLPDGMMLWKNRKNKYTVLVMGYYSDPLAQTEEWWNRAVEGMRPHEIDSEYLCSFHSRGGQKAFPWLDESPEKFIRPHQNYRNGSTWKIPEHWHLIGGLDYGGNQNPTSFHIYGIDEKKLWHSIYEYYKPSHFQETADVILGHPLYHRLTKIVVDPSVYKRDQHSLTSVGAFSSVGELLGTAGIHILESANNQRVAGLARVIDLFNQRPGEDRPTKIVFSDDCPEQIRELSRAVYKIETQAQLATRNPSDDIQKKDDHCFIAGTLVQTDSGYRPIEKIKIGEFVKTRGGYRRVISSWQTGIKNTLRLSFSNGSVILCTANHPIYTENRGFVRADELESKDECVSDPTWKKKKFYLTVLFFADIQNRIERTTEIILSVARSILGAASGIFTGKFGKLLTGKFPVGTLSTTAMAIPGTTPFPILSASLTQLTGWSTARDGAQKQKLRLDRLFGRKIEKKQKNGMLQPREEHGTPSTELNLGEKENQQFSSAIIAERNTNLCSLQAATRASVPETASLRRGAPLAWTILKLIAQNAVVHLQKIVTRNQLAAAPHVARLLRTERGPGAVPVYNLTVEGYHEYYANGILVSNSIDDLRYCAMSWDYEAEWNAVRSTNDFSIDVLEQEIEDRYESESLEHDLFN